MKSLKTNYIDLHSEVTVIFVVYALDYRYIPRTEKQVKTLLARQNPYQGILVIEINIVKTSSKGTLWTSVVDVNV